MNRAGVALALGLLTVLPVRTARVDRETAGHAMTAAPAAGLIVGGTAAVVLVAGEAMGLGASLAAVLAVAAMALLTRGLHLDGLADVADGLGSGRPADEALAIMKKSDIGPFGVVALLFTVLVQITALAQAQGNGHGPVAVLIAAVTGRLTVTWACRQGVPAARPDGLGALVAGSVRPTAARLATAMVLLVAVPAGALAAGSHGAVVTVVAVLAGLTTAMAMLRHATRRLRGVTGDVLGALVELGTAACLVVLAVL